MPEADRKALVRLDEVPVMWRPTMLVALIAAVFRSTCPGRAAPPIVAPSQWMATLARAYLAPRYESLAGGARDLAASAARFALRRVRRRCNRLAATGSEPRFRCDGCRPAFRSGAGEQDAAEDRFLARAAQIEASIVSLAPRGQAR